MENLKQVVRDIKILMFEDRDYDSLSVFKSMAEDERSFVITDEYGDDYRISVTKECNSNLNPMCSMRKVRAFTNSRKETVKGIGYFHMWGSHVVECFGDIESETVAIVEFDNGEVAEVFPDCLEFIHMD